MRVCIGGTFDVLHKGHKELISRAFKEAGGNGFVFIGVADGELASKKETKHTFEERRKTVESYVSMINNGTNYKIDRITDKYGPSVSEDYDVIVVSSETRVTAEEINNIRRDKGMRLLRIVTIPMVLADDDKPISSTRIKKKEIDAEGRIIKKHRGGFID